MGKSVILDYGLVLCRAPDPQVIETLTNMFGFDAATFWILYERNRGLYDRGELTPEEYWRKFAQDAGITLKDGQIQWLREYDIRMWSDLEEPLLLWVDDLRKAGYKTAILSNINREFAAHLRANCRWIKRFDFQVLSAEIGRVKPEPEAFKHCLRLLGSFPDEGLFVDDRETNVDAARRQGIRSILYHSTNQLRNELRDAGFGVLPPDSKNGNARNA